MSKSIAIRPGFALLLGLLSLPGCLSPRIADGDWDRVITEVWVLTHLDGRRSLDSKNASAEPLTLELSDDGRAAGFAGANRFFGSYENTAEGGLRFAALGSTRMFRDDPPGLMDQEQRYLAALAEVDAFRVRGEKLILLADGKRRLIFVRFIDERRPGTATPE